ncbi:hypothetical protein MMC17_001168 [Xylographa soralifera]|nr:hypothetical protein [Xylographa soralifera]
MANKRADPTTQLDVDTAILSYLLHSSTLTLLRHAPASPPNPTLPASARKLELPLQMVDSFLTLFHTAHPSAHPSPPLHLRLFLLRFTALFTLRHFSCASTPSPAAFSALRRTHAARAAAFLAQHDPLSGCDVAAYERDACASERPVRTSEHLTPASERLTPQLSLLDTLPLFVDLAARAAAVYGDAPTQQWRGLAGRYMAAAAVEAYLVGGAEGPGALREAFAWGPEGGAEGEEGWERERAEGVRMLVPPEGVGLREWLREVERERVSVRGVEEDVRGFLGGLLSAGEVPVLVRVEKEGLGEWGREIWGSGGGFGE